MVIRHKGLRQYYETGACKGLPANALPKIGRILDGLASATNAADMDMPGYRLHRLRGKLANYWSIRVTANWRMVFRIEGGEAVDVDLMVYH